jgi:predicted O-methyltransferase YrrM
MNDFIAYDLILNKYKTLPLMRKKGRGIDGLLDLINTAKQHKPDIKTIVEIGSFAGESSEIFASMFPDATIYCVDPWNDMDVEIYKTSKERKSVGWNYIPSKAEECFDEIASHYTNIVKLRMLSEEAVNQFDQIDMIYIDGIHTAEYIKMDLDMWIPKIVKGGIISGHDYTNGFRDYKLAIYNYFNQTKPAKFPDLSWLYVK